MSENKKIKIEVISSDDSSSNESDDDSELEQKDVKIKQDLKEEESECDSELEESNCDSKEDHRINHTKKAKLNETKQILEFQTIELKNCRDLIEHLNQSLVEKEREIAKLRKLTGLQNAQLRRSESQRLKFRNKYKITQNQIYYPICYLHYKYGNCARKCIKPCSFEEDREKLARVMKQNE